MNLFRPTQGKHSILWHIAHARTAEEIHQNLLRAMLLAASKDTKKKWRKAAEQKLGALRAEQIVRP